MLRKTPIKRGNNTLSRKSTLQGQRKLSRGAKPLKARPVSVEIKELEKAQNEAMLEVFNRHWEIKGNDRIYRQCEICHDSIWGENRTIYHHHILCKSIYKNLRYEIDNLQLVCWSCHTGVENGSIDNSEREQKVKMRFNIL